MTPWTTDANKMKPENFKLAVCCYPNRAHWTHTRENILLSSETVTFHGLFVNMTKFMDGINDTKLTELKPLFMDRVQ